METRKTKTQNHHRNSLCAAINEAHVYILHLSDGMRDQVVFRIGINVHVSMRAMLYIFLFCVSPILTPLAHQRIQQWHEEEKK